MDEQKWEWQPVVFVKAHDDGMGSVQSGTRAWAIPIDPAPDFVAYYRKLGCESIRFFFNITGA